MNPSSSRTRKALTKCSRVIWTRSCVTVELSTVDPSGRGWPKVACYLDVARVARSNRQQLESIAAGFKRPHRLGRDPDRIQCLHLVNLVVDPDPAAPGEHHVHLLGMAVAMALAFNQRVM